MKLTTILFVAICLLPALTLGAVIEENVVYNGWKCVALKNATTKVLFAPELGGRIIQYETDGHEWLWVNKDLAGKVFPVEENNNIDVWKNYGGEKLWPGPQGWSRPDQWPGPGDLVLEAPYTYEVVKKEGPEVVLKTIGSDQGGQAGVRFIRELVLKEGSNQLVHRLTMKNVSAKTVSWGIWSVAQMNWSDGDQKQGEFDWNEDARLVIPMNPKSPWPERFKVMFGLAESENWKPDYEKGLLNVHFMNYVGKIVMDVPAGWAAMVDPQAGQTFVIHFPYDPKATYPDGGNFESWVAGKGDFWHANKRRVAEDLPSGRLIEMEVLGPKTTLKPGESTSLEMTWDVNKGGLEQAPRTINK